MQNISTSFNRAVSALIIVSVVTMSLVAAIPVLAYEGITDATVTPGTIDISTPTNLTVSFTTPVEIPSDGEVVIIFPYQFGLQEITGVTSSDIDGVLSSNVQTFTELHITRATDSAPVSFGSLIDDLVIENVTTPPILGWVGDYNVQVLDANGDVLAAGLASGQTFEDLVTPPAAPLSLTLTAPNGGEVFIGDDETVISWVTTGGVPFASLYFSDNGGLSYELVASDISGTSYNWTVPNIDVPLGKIKVVSVDEYGSDIQSDFSDSNFEIVHTVEVVDTGDEETVVPHDTLIKGTSLSAVYYFSSDAKRYVFPSEQIFYSWFENFDDVVEIDDDVLASFKLGQRITMAPGSLIKITSDPKVYAIDSDGAKHHIASEAVASSLFGTDWSSQVVDVDITQWFDYPTGDQLTSSSAFSATKPSFPVTPSN
ncbi:hypothetical protein HOI83_00140 [Candidatus Uhrbacteria bacterium]|jgi:hypothetical protein|nr:hypothetical protein [Candidatus Uhrbacteria bacterium]